MWTRRLLSTKRSRLRARRAVLAAFAMLAFAGWGPSAAASPGEECEQLAAADSSAVAKAVPFEAINAAAVVAVCGTAVESESNTAHYRFLLSRGLLKAQRFAEARAEAEQAVLGGETGAHRILAVIYQMGLGVPKDTAKAREHFRTLAEAGFTPARIQYAHMLETGEGGPQNEAQAVRWYRAAAESGNASAQGQLAHLLMDGPAQLHNATEAVGWYEKAVAQGDPLAGYRYAELLIEGREVNADARRGVQL